jgi:hypothetical protein
VIGWDGARAHADRRRLAGAFTDVLRALAEAARDRV